MARPDLLNGNEFLKGGGGICEKATVLDSWRWAFSDLRMNDVRGV
jgi:hypothetical protein